ncbi:hypothetical protein HZB02_02535 [Candidatus Woesearchaeota archaeon]|nr:hypothetical protein [Candidatus Woesearchaeota archaeon]
MDKPLVSWVLIVIGALLIVGERAFFIWASAQVGPPIGDTTQMTYQITYFPLLWPTIIGMIFFIIGVFLLLQKRNSE